MITFSWQITPEQVWPGISARQVANIERDLVKLCDAMAEEVETWMKANAPWQDVTEAARKGLHAELVHIAREFAGVMFSHGEDVEHAIFLEVAHRGQYSIIAPALDYFAPKLKAGAREIVRRYSS